MIEVVHFRRRDGKQMSAAFVDNRHDFYNAECKTYAERYAAGLEPAFYNLPAPLGYNEQFAASYFIELLKEMLVHV